MRIPYLDRLRPRMLFPHTFRLFEEHLDWRLTGRWMLLSAAVGIVVGIGALILSQLISLASSGMLMHLVGYQMPVPGGEAPDGAVFDLERALEPTRRWLLFVVPTLGGLVSGWLVFTFAPDAEGHGTDSVIHAFHRNRGIIGPRVPVVKTIASAITIGSGGSAGREGPIAQIGGALASLLAQGLKLGDRDRRMLLVAGMAAGVGSIFLSPLGGAFFAVEVLYRQDIETEALMPAVVAGVTGYSVYSTIEGTGAVFLAPDIAYVSPLELVPLVVFALLCAAVGIVYVDVFHGVKRRIFDPMRVPKVVKPAVGGFAVGAVAFFFPPILGSSYGWLQQAMDGTLPIALMATLAGLKILSTSFTIGSGGSGGVFAPSLVIGGMIGGVFGAGMHTLVPDIVVHPQAYVMIGMATLLAGVAKVPLSTTIMISEITGSYRLLVPLIFAGVVVHLLVSRRGLFTQQVGGHADSPAHRHDLLPDLLASLRVRHVVKPMPYFHVLEPGNTLAEILDVFTRTQEVVIPVADPGRPTEYTGLVVLDEVQSLLASTQAMQHLIVAHDIQSPFAFVPADGTLEDARAAFERTGYPELPVVDQGQITGFIRKAQLVSEYHRAYLRTRSAFEPEQ
jgi:CIC family chloride channel protein